MPADMELQVVASLLRRGRSLDQLSTGLTLLGVLFGLLFGIPFWAAEVAGELIDLQRGSNVKLGGNCQRIGPSFSFSSSTPEAKNFLAGRGVARVFATSTL